MPVAALNISPNMCGAVPWPKPQSNLPGLALACSISCRTEVAARSGLTTRIQANDETVATDDFGRERVTDCPEQQRVAIGRGFRELVDADRPAAAGTILDDDRLAQTV